MSHPLSPHGAPEPDGVSGAVPQTTRIEDPSLPNPPAAPGPIVTVSADEIARFFVRVRRDVDTDRWDVRLDAALREILERANDFVPSEAGGILLDDPRTKLAGVRTPRLTFIAAYGPDGGERLGRRLPSDHGVIGRIYQTGGAHRVDRLDPHDPLAVLMGARAGRGPVESIVGVPVIVGESICGVLQLVNRRSGGPYSARDAELLRIFAAYMSSSIQNALDAIRARSLTRLDQLTGLYNGRYFHTRLRDEVERAEAHGANLSLLFLDLDRFKQVNDRFGHLAGSWLLREMARLLAENTPPGSVVARYGGDEFAVILVGAGQAAALQTAEHLRRTIAQAVVFDSETEPDKPAQRLPNIYCSVGVACYREHLLASGPKRRPENVFLRLADAAMYRAKASGRDRVELAAIED